MRSCQPMLVWDFGHVHGGRLAAGRFIDLPSSPVVSPTQQSDGIPGRGARPRATPKPRHPQHAKSGGGWRGVRGNLGGLRRLAIAPKAQAAGARGNHVRGVDTRSWAGRRSCRGHAEAAYSSAEIRRHHGSSVVFYCDLEGRSGRNTNSRRYIVITKLKLLNNTAASSH